MNSHEEREILLIMHKVIYNKIVMKNYLLVLLFQVSRYYKKCKRFHIFICRDIYIYSLYQEQFWCNSIQVFPLMFILLLFILSCIYKIK